MSETYLTKCPHCGSAFKINDELLGAAKGKVRCGSCMKVFNAKEQLFQASPQKSTSPTSGTGPSFIDLFTKKTEPAAQSAGWRKSLLDAPFTPDPDDIIFEDNPELDRQDKHYFGPAKKDPLEDSFNTDFLELDSTPVHDFVEPGETDTTLDKNEWHDDESWAEKMLEEEMSQSAASGISGRSHQNKYTGEPDSDSYPSEDQTKQDMDSTHSGAAPKKQAALNHTPPPKDSTEPSSTAATSGSFSPLRESDFLAADPAASYSQYQTLRFDPIEARPGENYTFAKKMLVILLCILLVAAIVGQFAWLHMDKLSLYPQLRPAYVKACELLDCNLPDMVDLSRIKSQNLVVRSHPVTKNALLIDAVIINKATFEQPFPNLDLYFSDLNNNVVTKRTFTPGEYLIGEAIKYKMMPVMAPVHLAIEVKDPGPQAVNYSLDFQKAK
ncbi:MAG: hypothetical protein CSB48_13615 [Proteobacteria bacterium]|nr:MAG: hypothetical protein CSB48_13615 [Pseudomonadota bacterium]PIE40505.1 MAG: hypothetical protein CSA51_00410 [Gammaproteobacteria bacterium]